MCAAHNPLQTRPMSGEKFYFPSRPSLASIHCLCRPDRACFFLFCFSMASLSHFSPNGDNAVFPHLGIAASPGFIQNWLTRLHQSGFASSMVLLSLPGSQNRTQGRVWFSPSFLEMLLLRQRRQVTLQLVIYCLVDGKVRCRSAPHRISCAPWWVPYQSSTYPLAAECILLRCLRSCRYAGKSTQCWASTCGFSYPHRKSSRHREIVHLGLAPA